MPIYLDYAAATPVDSDVLAKMQPFFAEQFYNPSALYGPAVRVSKALSTARSDIAKILGAKASEIIFTAGGTEANNLAVHGVMQRFPKAHMVLSAIEHDSVREPARQYNFSQLKVDADGLVNTMSIQNIVKEDTVLVSVMYANNEIGTVQPLKKIATELQKIKTKRLKDSNDLPLYFHVDAAQAGNYLDMHVHRLGADLMTINGGKLYGPKQSGILFVGSGINLKPMLTGGGQERSLRSGTENIAGAVGLAAALKQSSALRHDESERLKILQKQFIEELRHNFTDVIVNGSLKYRLPNNLHITLPGTDNERVLMQLDNEGIYAAAGSACSAGSGELSHVLDAIGIDEDSIKSSLRFSMGRQTSAEDVTKTVSALKRLLAC